MSIAYLLALLYTELGYTIFLSTLTDVYYKCTVLLNLLACVLHNGKKSTKEYSIV